MTQFGHLQPAQISPMMANALIASWKHDLRPNTCWNYRHEHKAILLELQRFGAPPIQLAPAPKRQRATTATISELAAILRTPPPWLRLYLLLYFQCGLRASEALAVTSASWNREHHTVTVPIKGGFTRTAQITPDVEDLLRSMGDPDPSTPAIHVLHGTPIGYQGLRRAWERHKKACGVRQEVNAHDLRRTAATIVYDTTKDLRAAQQLLGHKHLSSTLGYLAPLAPDDVAKYQELLHFEHFRSDTKN